MKKNLNPVASHLESSLLDSIPDKKEPDPLDRALQVWDAIDDSSELWQRRNPTAVYVHVPFCNHRCGYCNFAVITGRDDLMSRYVAAMQKELAQLQHKRIATSIFVGGGTPTSLSSDALSHLLQSIHQWFDFDKHLEWTFEANPNDVTADLCSRLCDSGVNRLSIGLQSFNDQKLQNLDRDHSSHSARKAIDTALKSFENVSIDLIFAAPHETQVTWTDDLDAAIKSGVQHISTYGLTIEKGTRFWSIEQKNQLDKPTDTIEMSMYELAIERLTNAGYEHYEVSNFGIPDHYSRHNMAYWQLNGWWAFGCSASRSIGRTRSTNHSSVVKYISLLERNLLPISDIQVLSHYEWTIDAFVFGMRTRRGIDVEYIRKVGEPEAVSMILNNVEVLVSEGMMKQDQSLLQLTHRGLIISDSLWPRFYAESI